MRHPSQELWNINQLNFRICLIWEQLLSFDVVSGFLFFLISVVKPYSLHMHLGCPLKVLTDISRNCSCLALFRSGVEMQILKLCAGIYMELFYSLVHNQWMGVCGSQTFGCHDKYETEQLKKEKKFIFAHGFRGFSL
jgi:hypothetical protein